MVCVHKETAAASDGEWLSQKNGRDGKHKSQQRLDCIYGKYCLVFRYHVTFAILLFPFYPIPHPIYTQLSLTVSSV